MKDEEILPLTSLRFVAALYVFLFHIHIRWPLAASPLASHFFDVGAVGMSLFFVLSGFVLAHRYSRVRVAYRSYLINRFARIYPIYFIAALVTVPWLGISLGGGSATDLVRPVVKGVVLLATNVFLMQAWFPQLFGYWNDGGSWSISAEAFFYVLFPFILAALAGKSTHTVGWVALVAYVCAVLPGVSYAAFDPKPDGPVFYAMPIFRLPEFVCGICAYLATRSLKPGLWMEGAAVAAVVLLSAYLALVGNLLPLYVGHNWLGVPVIALVLVVVSKSRGPLVKLLSLRPLVWAGKVSYCFYSFQLLLILLLVDHHNRLVQTLPWLGDPRLLALTSFLLLTGVSGSAHHFLEEPLRRWLRKFDVPTVPPLVLTTRAA